jgi:hypothetical protein
MIGYEDVVCHFCGKPEAGYARAEDEKPNGPYFDACENCARKPYPQPKQLDQNRKEKSINEIGTGTGETGA